MTKPCKLEQSLDQYVELKSDRRFGNSSLGGVGSSRVLPALLEGAVLTHDARMRLSDATPYVVGR